MNQNHMTKRVLITGGAGFLGSHLVDRLLSRGDEVVCVDNFFTGSNSNIEHVLDHSRFELIKHDIVFPLNVEISQIYNLACPASPVHYQMDPLQTIKTNVYGAINMLNLARQANARIFQASTSEIYGDPLVHPQAENYWGNVNPVGIRSCYDEGKRCAETIFFDYQRQYKIDIRVARIFNTYGPRMHVDDGRVVSNFIIQALTGEDISIYGDGSQTRSFCFVDDLIDGFINFMDLDSRDGLCFPGPVNLGNPIEVTINYLAKKIIEIVGSKSKLIFLDLPSDDPQQRRPDLTLARKYLKGWEPKVQLNEGLLRTIKYFDKELCKVKNSLII